MPRESNKVIILINEGVVGSQVPDVEEQLNQMVVGRNNTLTLAMKLQSEGKEVYFAKGVEIGTEIGYVEARKVHFTDAAYEAHDEYGKALRSYSAAISDLEKGAENQEIDEKEYQDGLEAAKAGLSQRSHKLDEMGLFVIEDVMQVPYGETNCIFNRLEPTERLQDQVQKLRVVQNGWENPVPVICTPNEIDKYEPLALPKGLHPDTITFSQDETDISPILAMLRRHGRIVIKPAKATQGKGVEQILLSPNDKENEDSIRTAIAKIAAAETGNFDGQLIVQEFVGGVGRGDIRTIFFRNSEGDFEFGGHVARQQLGGGFINCVSSGLAAPVLVETMLSTKELEDLDQNTEMLLAYFNKHKGEINTPIIGVDSIPKFATKKEANLAENAGRNSIYVGEMNYFCVALSNLRDHLLVISPFAEDSLTSRICDGIYGYVDRFY